MYNRAKFNPNLGFVVRRATYRKITERGNRRNELCMYCKHGHAVILGCYINLSLWYLVFCTVSNLVVSNMFVDTFLCASCI